MKIFLFLIFSISFLFSNTFTDVANKEKELFILNKKFPNEKILKIYSTFEKDTGIKKSEILKLINRKDLNWLQGMDLFYNQKRDSKINDDKIKIPKYKEAIDKLLVSSAQDNILSSYLGEHIISFYLIGMNNNSSLFKESLREYITTYYPKFLNKLIEKEYCYIYLKTAVYYDSGLIKSDLETREKIIKKGLEQCNDSNYPYIIRNLKIRSSHISAKRKYMERKK